MSDSSRSHLPAQEIADQIDTIRARGRDAGHIHFNMTALMKDVDSLDEKLASRYGEAALVPASPWLGARAPARPTVRVTHDAATGDLMVRLEPGKDSKVWLWTVRSLGAVSWSSEVLPGWLRAHRLPDPASTRVVVTAVSRTGVESPEVEVDVRTAPVRKKAGS